MMRILTKKIFFNVYVLCAAFLVFVMVSGAIVFINRDNQDTISSETQYSQSRIHPLQLVRLQHMFELGQSDYYYFSESIFFYSEEVVGVDLASFRTVSSNWSVDNSWALDKRHVYKRGVKQDHLSPKKFRIHSYPYVSDAFGVWLDPQVFVESGDRRVPADPSSFSAITNWYGRDVNNVFYHNSIITDADPESFQSLEGSYAKDRDSVFYRAFRIPDAHSESFNPLGNGYAQDVRAVYYDGVSLEGVDRGSFEVLGNGYAMDANTLLYEGEPLDLDIDLHTLSLEHISNGILVDASKVFTRSFDFDAYEHMHLEIEGADPDTIQVEGVCTVGKFLSHYYLRDKFGVYIHTDRMTEIDRDSFQFLDFVFYGPFGTSFARDKNSLFRCDLSPTPIDESFEYLGDLYYIHNDSLWFDSIEVLPRPDLDSLKLLGEMYISDDNSVYLSGSWIVDADPDTFVLLDGVYAYDKHALYRYGKKCSHKTKVSCFQTN